MPPARACARIPGAHCLWLQSRAPPKPMPMEPGPTDSLYLFERFSKMMDDAR